MQVENLVNLIMKNNLRNAVEDIRALARQSIRLLASPASSANQKVGMSRLGGQPDLPAGFAWPTKGAGKPMSFVAQICLEDIAGFSPAKELPASGTLSFFYDAAQETYGASPDDRGGWSVNFFEPAAPLKPVPFPDDLPQPARFTPLDLSFHSEWTLPPDPRQVNSSLNWSDKEQQGYEALLRDFRGPGDRKLPHHRMFGWPDQIQDDMQLQSAMMSGGITDMNDPRMKAATQAKPSWELLLQVDSDDRAGMRWASYGMIYYWITDQALKDHQYNQSWLILQSD